MKIGVFQFASKADISMNSDTICRAISLAANDNVRILVFHECAACGYPPIETPDINKIDFVALEELFTRTCQLAKKHEMYIALGTIREENGKRYNSIRLISPDGVLLGDYDKRAQWGWDLNHFERGVNSGIYDIDGVKVGFRICFEVRFPEYFRELFEEKIELCFVSFSDVSKEDSPERYNIIKSHLITRAVENVMTIISVNSISNFQTAPTAIFGIDGHIISEAQKNKESLLVYDYTKPEIGYGEKGRIENSIMVMRKTKSVD